MQKWYLIQILKTRICLQQTHTNLFVISPDQNNPYPPGMAPPGLNAWNYQPKMASADTFEPLPPRASTNNRNGFHPQNIILQSIG